MQKRMRLIQKKDGQTMIEYVIVVGILMASFAILILFQDAFDDYGSRIMNLAGYHYP